MLERGLTPYKLYVIPGSHACRSAMLMLDHKRVPYRRVEFVTLMHPVTARLRGFDAGGQTRTAGGKRPLGLRMGDRMGTVPGLAAGKERISTNYAIARFLDERHPDPPLFPPDPARRAAVEEAERWANGPLQMAARRIPGAAIARDPVTFGRSTGRRAARASALQARADAAAAHPEDHRRRLRHQRQSGARPGRRARPPCSTGSTRGSRDGVLGGEELNAADFMVAPSLALILYRPDVMADVRGPPGARARGSASAGAELLRV